MHNCKCDLVPVWCARVRVSIDQTSKVQRICVIFVAIKAQTRALQFADTKGKGPPGLGTGWCSRSHAWKARVCATLHGPCITCIAFHMPHSAHIPQTGPALLVGGEFPAPRPRSQASASAAEVFIVSAVVDPRVATSREVPKKGLTLDRPCCKNSLAEESSRSARSHLTLISP